MSTEISLVQEYKDALDKSMDQTDEVINLVKNAIKELGDRNKEIRILKEENNKLKEELRIRREREESEADDAKYNDRYRN